MKKILIMGLPGSGKTTLAKELASRLSAVHFNGDDLRQNINTDLYYDIESRIEQSRRMNWLADQVKKSGNYVICDFVCPTEQTRNQFHQDILIWMDTISASRYPQNDSLWQPPANYDYRITNWPTAQDIDQLLININDNWDPRLPTAQLLGRYQPPHEGHVALVKHALQQYSQVNIMVREPLLDSKNPFTYQQIYDFWQQLIKTHNLVGVKVTRCPNISHVFYGRDVGYKISQIKLSDNLEQISATQIRRQMGI